MTLSRIAAKHSPSKHVKHLRHFASKLDGVRKGAQVATQALQAASRKPFETFTALGLTGVGAWDIIRNGDLFSGLTTCSIGAAQLYKIYCDDGGQSKLAELLQNASLDVELIKTFQAENKASLNTIKENIKTVDEAIMEMRGVLNDLSGSFDSLDEGAAHLQQSLKSKCEQSLHLLITAKTNFQAAENLALSVEVAHSHNLKNLENIKALATSAENHFKSNKTADSIADLKSLHQLTDQMYQDFATTNSQLGAMKGKIEEGCSALLDVSALQQELMTESTQMITALQTTIVKSKENLQVLDAKLQVCEESNAKSKKAIKKLEENNGLMDRVIQELSDEIATAQGIAAYTATFDEILVGGGAASLTAAALSAGPALTVAAPLAGVIVYKNRKSLTNFAKKALGIKTSEPELSTNVENRVAIAFDTQSSGFWNHYVKGKTCSTTVGSIQIRLPNDTLFNLRFDLNEKGDKISKKDCFALVSALKDCMQKNPASASACQSIIQSLRSHTFNRAKGEADIKGVILQNNVVFEHLDRLCKSHIKSFKS